MALDPQFWLHRRVLVTGHTGFSGVWLCAWLTELGAEVTGYALPAGHSRPLFDAAGLERRMVSCLGDLRDPEWIAALVRRVRPEVVFHLAAQSLVREAAKAPVETFATNVMGTVHLLEAARRVGSLRAVVVVTSDKVYREPAGACREQDPLGAEDPYGASKACVEHVVAAYRRCFLTPADGVGLAAARAGNLLGGGDFAPHRLLPDVARAIQRGTPVVLRHPHHVRPWQHVLEAVHGYLLLAQALARDPRACSESWNFGPPVRARLWTVRELAEAALEAFGGGEIAVEEGEDELEIPIQRLSPNKALARLGWRARLSMEERVRWTVRGYRALFRGEGGAWLYDQIRTYAARVAGEDREVVDAVA